MDRRQEVLYEHARHHFGLGGMPGSGFIQTLFKLCNVADFSNLMKLREAFPAEIDAYIEIRDNS